MKCEVVAPTLVPVKAGDRVKTERRDAAKLARGYRAGDLTRVWVPDAAHEALRGIATVSAVTIVAEVGKLSRFAKARQLMGYGGGVPREHSSGEQVRRAQETPGGPLRGGEGDRLEGPAPVAQPLPQTDRPREDEAAGRHGGGARAVGLHLGDWRRGGTASLRAEPVRGVTESRRRSEAQ